jgi:hypothetical protein
MNGVLIVDPRIPRASRRPAAILAGVTLELEYLAVSLSEPWCRYGILTIRVLVTLISLSDVGKVLAGIQVPPADGEAFSTFLERLGYAYLEETGNAIYRQFLRR